MSDPPKDSGPSNLENVKTELNSSNESVEPKTEPGNSSSGRNSDADTYVHEDEKIQEEEDVPADFFDDFMNHEFMAGLDIIDDDAWHEKEEGKRKAERSKKPSKEGGSGPSRVSDNERRDPAKTKRDIQRDKLKCQKDKERKIIDEKLKFCETGLVPPGMEMEVDLGEIEKGVERTSNRKENEPSTSKQRDDYVDREKERSTRRERVERRSSGRSYERRRSPRRNYYRSPSPYRRQHSDSPPSRRRSPYSPSESKRDRDHYRSERDRRSPNYRRRRDRNFSPVRRRSRSRSRSNKRRKEEAKKSFLQEIDEKLNEVRPPGPYQGMYPYPTPGPVPAPPGPLVGGYYGGPAPTGASMYDEQYFVGGAPQIPPQPQPYFNNVECYEERDKEEDQTANLIKMLDEKRISLSDFLTITAKSKPANSSNPEALNEKIKVISRCQNAIKFLENERFSGRLIVKKRPKDLEENKYQSPLLKTHNIEFPFTSAKKTEDAPILEILNKLLQHVGIDKKLEIDENAVRATMRNEVKNIQQTDKQSQGLSKLTQTESFVCEVCEERKNVSVSHVKVQCGEVGVSVGVQVNEEELRGRKAHSLAALTPAQLLGRGESTRQEQEDYHEDTFERRGIRPLQPPPPRVFPNFRPNTPPGPPQFARNPRGRNNPRLYPPRQQFGFGYGFNR